MIRLLFILLMLQAQDAAPPQVRKLIDTLRSEDIEERDQAVGKLVEIGKPAVPELRKAAETKDLEVAARISFILKQIDRVERIKGLKEKLHPALLKEAPRVLQDGTSESRETWLTLLRDLTGYARHRGESLGQEVEGIEYKRRKYASATRRDLSALSQSYVSGSWRDPYVEGLIYAIADRCAVSLPREVVTRRQAFEKAGGRLPGPIPRYGTRLGRRRRPTPIERLAKKDEDPWSKWARSARSGDRSEGIDALGRLLKHPENEIRLEAIAGLDRWNAEGVGTELAECVDDPSPKVQKAAIKVIGRLHLEDAADALMEKVKEEERSIGLQALEALAGMGLPKSIPLLEESMGDDSRERRRWGIFGLARSRSRDHALRIAPFLSDPLLRQDALEALGLLRDLRSGEHVVRWMNKVETREAAIQALGRIGHREAISDLVLATDDINPEIRNAARVALARMGAPELLDCLGGLFETKDLIRGSYHVSPLYWELNKYAAPDAWKKISRVKLTQRRYTGSLQEVVKALERETEITLNVPEGAAFARDPQVVRLPPRVVSLENALYSLQFKTPMGFIIQAPDRIDIVPWIFAGKHWRAWYRARKN